jgi:hypothetical protein
MWSWDSSVRIAVRLQAGPSRNEDSVPSMGKIFFLFCRMQAYCVVHQTFYLTGTGGFLPGDKAA